ncbi:MAG: DUF2809 domain-containing protein [Bacteroidota bacterium]
MKQRLWYAGLALLTIPIGLGSRIYDAHLGFYGTYAPDTWWTVMFYLGFRALLVHRSRRVAAIATIALSFGIEFLQLYHAPWIEAIRATRLGGLILGFSFLWTDLVCYTVGLLLAWGADEWWERKFGK